MVSLKEAEIMAQEKYGLVDFHGEYPEFYLFFKINHDNIGTCRVWVGKYLPKACDTPEEWYKIKEAQDLIRKI